MTITSKSRRWELLHSWWILLTMVPLAEASWLSFLYIGIRTRQIKWILWAILYSTAALLQVVVNHKPGFLTIVTLPQGNFIFNLLLIYVTIIWGISVIHAFLVREEYLLRLEAIQEQNTFEKQRKSHEERDKTPIQSTPESETYIENKPIDINHDPEELIAKLPGIGAEIAKKVVEIRQSQPFGSLDEFAEVFRLEPQILEKIRPLVIAKPPKPKEPSEYNESGRVVDY